MFGTDPAQLERLLGLATQSVQKATISTTTGIVMYDLQPQLKVMYPVLRPFTAKYLPRRVSPIGGTMTNAKLLTGINSAQGGVGLAEGQRGGLVNVNEQDIASIYRTIGQDASITFEAEEAAQGFDDARATRTTTLLNANLIIEEKINLFGNGGNNTAFGAPRPTAFGTPAAPVIIAGTAPGTLPAAAYVVFVVALTSEGFANASIPGGVSTLLVRSNVDGSTTSIPAGSSNVSASSNSVTLGAAGSISAAVTFVPGAFGYAWFIGTSKASAALAAITYLNQVVITAPPAGTQFATAVTADNSVNNYVWDGIITQQMNPASGAYVQSLNGANLTANGNGGINEIDTALESLYNNYRLGVQHILCGADMKIAINRKILASGVYRLNAVATGGAIDVNGNSQVSQYLNVFTNELVTLEIHPYFPQGLIWGFATMLPYTTPNVPMPFRLQARTRDWYEIEWDIVTRQRVIGQYVSATLMAYAPFAAFILCNCGPN
jgi:hypothetical protein